MLSDKSTVCPINLLDTAHQKKGVKAAIVNAGKTLPMLSAMDAVKENLIEPVFIGDENDSGKNDDLRKDARVKDLIYRPLSIDRIINATQQAITLRE